MAIRSLVFRYSEGDTSLITGMGASSTSSASTMERTRRYEALHRRLARAERAGDVTEFQALSLYAVLAMAEESELARDYLEMAEAVASRPQERAVAAENWATFDLLQGDSLAAAERCLSALDDACQTEGLWRNLVIALYRLGDLETLDAMLRRFAELDDEIVARLVGVLLAQPLLREVCARPAFRALLARPGPAPVQAAPLESSPHAKAIARSMLAARWVVSCAPARG